MEILTGNELISGATVYLDPRGQWVEELQEARVFAAEEGEVFVDGERLKPDRPSAMAATTTHRTWLRIPTS